MEERRCLAKNENTEIICPVFSCLFIQTLVEYPQAINPLELAMEALKEMQSRFYRDFPPHPKEQVYGFATPSTMKPTQWSCKFFCLYWKVMGEKKIVSLYHAQIFIADPGGGINQIPAECTISGDVRFIIFPKTFLRPFLENEEA